MGGVRFCFEARVVVRGRFRRVEWKRESKVGVVELGGMVDGVGV